MKSNKFLDSAKEILEKRWGSAMYGTFAISWIIWNWQAIYVTLFVDQNLLFDTVGQLKLHYVLSMYSWSFFAPTSLLYLVIGPAVSTFAIIWGISWLDFLCHKKDVSNEIKKENERIEQQAAYLKKEKKVLKEKEENVNLAKEIEQDMTDEQKWDDQYIAFYPDKTFQESMKQLKTCLYQFNGQTHWEDFPNGVNFDISANQLAYLDTNGFIEFDSRDRTRISATQKGKYFIKKLMDSKFFK